MSTVISLKSLVGEMMISSDEVHTYLDPNSGEFFTITDDLQHDLDRYLEAVENGTDYALPSWMNAPLDEYKKFLASDDYLELPTSFEVNDYNIIQDFCYLMVDAETSQTLLNLIRGSGAFARFNNAIYQLGLQQDWYTYKNNAYKQYALDWLESHQLEYVDDMDTPGAP